METTDALKRYCDSLKEEKKEHEEQVRQLNFLIENTNEPGKRALQIRAEYHQKMAEVTEGKISAFNDLIKASASPSQEKPQ